MKIIKNSHSGVGGIATESMEMLRYVKKHPEHSLSLIHRDINHEKYFKVNSENTSTHYLIVTKNVTELLKGVRNIDDFYNKHIGKIKDMERIIEEEKPDVALCSGSFYYPWFLMKAAENKKLPIFIRYAGIIEKEERKEIWHDLGKEFIKEGHRYIFPSEHSKKTIEEINGKEIKNSCIVYNGVNDIFFKESKRKSNGEFNVGFVGRLANVKNPEYMIKLSDELKKMGVINKMTCVTDTKLFADPPKNIKNMVKKFYKRDIKIKSEMSKEELSEFYRSINVLVTPSHFETFGIVPLETIATGTPAIINKTAGVKEVFYKLGLGEFVADFNNVEDVARKIECIKREKIIITEDIREKVKKDYNWDTIIESCFKSIKEDMVN